MDLGIEIGRAKRCEILSGIPVQHKFIPDQRERDIGSQFAQRHFVFRDRGISCHRAIDLRVRVASIVPARM
jgi:hypothetical protein